MAEQLTLIEGVKTKPLDPYPCRCPYCYRALTRRGGMSVSVKYGRWIQKNQELVSQQLLVRQTSGPQHQIQLRPDLQYAIEIEAQMLEITPEVLIEQLVEAYIDGLLKRLKRRRKKVELQHAQCQSHGPRPEVQPRVKKIHAETSDGPKCQPGFYQFQTSSDLSQVTCQNCLKLMG